MTCMASALVCGASSTVRHSALFPSFQLHPCREREVKVDQKAACQKEPEKEQLGRRALVPQHEQSCCVNTV